VLLVGHGHVRREVMGDEARPPGADELDRMRRLVRAAMEGGAAGLSTGLSYVPGRFAATDEVIALAREVAPYGGIYISHLRDQGAGLVESVRETARIGREAGITVVATHLKISGRANFGRSVEALDAIEDARRQGIAFYADQYPYTTSSNGIDVHFLSSASPRPPADAIAEVRRAPSETLADLVLASHELAPKMHTRAWLLTRPRAELEARAAAGLTSRGRDGESTRVHVRALLEDPYRRSLLYRAVADEIARWGGADTYVIERAPDARLEGRTLEEAAATLGVSAPEAAIALELMDAQVTQFHMAEEDVVQILRRDFTATSTDGTIPVFGVGTPHPRSYGTFPRKIRTYALDRGVLSLPFAIRSMTGLAAEILGLTDRGTIRPGAWADLVVFDPRTIRDRATYREPHRYSEGIELLLVNGVPVVEAGRVTGARPGRILGPRGRAPVRPAPAHAAP
ncbi:MAG: N-acyl-D-amino-acid deacylase family protein, partial [Gemmatimonadota bacterium]